ncbi:exonuclease domain-containing protein [Mycobacterium sp. 48b]|uniref:3'-5' exonuclease n=1 Tax=Mycobacterium sp. 48b TaxID=3400426 RepID=UPI003AB02EAD
MSKRQLIVVDLETTGLNTATCWPLEVAAINTATGHEIRFNPFVTRSALGEADFQALQVNRYYERGSWEDMLASAAENHVAYQELEKMLTGNTLGGSNPRFDAAVLARLMGEVWHHRLADLSAYAAPAMGLGPDELPGLAKVCEHFGITNYDEHSAYGDATATASCFRAAREWYLDRGSKAPVVPIDQVVTR